MSLVAMLPALERWQGLVCMSNGCLLREQLRYVETFEAVAVPMKACSADPALGVSCVFVFRAGFGVPAQTLCNDCLNLVLITRMAQTCL